MEYKQFYRRKLPHIHSPGTTLFVTFRLAETIPKAVIDQWRQEKKLLEIESARMNRNNTVSPNQRADFLDFQRRWFARFEEILDAGKSGPVWLKNPEIAALVADSLKYRDGKVYDLKAFTIMSNHVHAVFAPFLNFRSLREVAGSNPLKFESEAPTLGAIMQSLKGYTAYEANKILNRNGKFWETESYDHEVRNAEELNRIIRYVLNNPVKAKLVKDWRDWPWNWLKTQT